MFLLYHFFIDSLNTCNRADQSSTVKDDGWTLQSHIQIYESENGSLKKKRRVELPPQCKVKKKNLTLHFTLPLTLLFPSLSLGGSDLRSAVCFPGERQRELSLHLSLSLVIPPPSTLPPLLTLSLPPSLSPGSWSVTTCQMPVSLPHTSFVSVQLSNEILSELQMSEMAEMLKRCTSIGGFEARCP